MTRTYQIKTKNDQTTITLSFSQFLTTSDIFSHVYAIDPDTRMNIDISGGQPLIIFGIKKQQEESLDALKKVIEKEGFTDCNIIAEPMPLIYWIGTCIFTTHIQFSFSSHLFAKGIFSKVFSLDPNANVSISVTGDKPTVIVGMINQPTDSLNELIELIENAGFTNAETLKAT